MQNCGLSVLLGASLAVLRLHVKTVLDWLAPDQQIGEVIHSPFPGTNPPRLCAPPPRILNTAEMGSLACVVQVVLASSAQAEEDVFSAGMKVEW